MTEKEHRGAVEPIGSPKGGELVALSNDTGEPLEHDDLKTLSEEDNALRLFLGGGGDRARDLRLSSRLAMEGARTTSEAASDKYIEEVVAVASRLTDQNDVVRLSLVVEPDDERFPQPPPPSAG